MKKQWLALSLLVSSVAYSGVISADTTTFTSTVGAGLITESSGVTTGSINYNPLLWMPGSVTSATLTLFISDDVSTILGGFSSIDLPREWAQITAISDGSLSMGAQTAVEVQNTSALFAPSNVAPFDDNTFLGADSFENPLTTSPITTPALVAASGGVGLVAQSIDGYFDIDVSGFLNDVNASGTIEFDLEALNLYGASALPADFLAAIAPFGFQPIDPQNAFEDFNFISSQLRVEYTAAVPAPSVVFLLVSGLLGLAASKKRFNQKELN